MRSTPEPIAANLALLEPKKRRQYSIKNLLSATTLIAIGIVTYTFIYPSKQSSFKPEGVLFNSINGLPACSLYWFYNDEDDLVSGFAAFGRERPILVVSHSQGNFRPNGTGDSIFVPQDGWLYIYGPDKKLHRTEHQLSGIVPMFKKYTVWGETIREDIDRYEWKSAEK